MPSDGEPQRQLGRQPLPQFRSSSATMRATRCSGAISPASLPKQSASTTPVASRSDTAP